MPLPVLLGHGASGSAASMRPHVDGLKPHGVQATAIDLPHGTAERAVPVFRQRLVELNRPAVIGGQSFGGRVASMLAAADGTDLVAGLVLLSYPLHRPGHPDEQRTEHWPHIRCPVLLLTGGADPFAGIALMEAALPALANVEMVVYPRAGHGLRGVLDDALERIAAFVTRVSASAPTSPDMSV
ncbi:MAG: dienelactone hydrolase family protein [Candidatus Dormibacteraeota bacterium]|uniref:Dienelactone hydrolase family protein n=1 Tax=Candidatus Amunia macphersoniae TaxID=3127014 RepID=A0A934NGH9_9BACT|nr:dienelactone hydrolase family protein [Candidatus Dormibacteraeota bacterium]